MIVDQLVRRGWVTVAGIIKDRCVTRFEDGIQATIHLSEDGKVGVGVLKIRNGPLGVGDFTFTGFPSVEELAMTLEQLIRVLRPPLIRVSPAREASTF